MCEELFKENLAVKYSLYRNTLPPKDFRLIQEFYAWLSAQQGVQSDVVSVEEQKEYLAEMGKVAFELLG